jgi:membrane-bound serine protease (ClpP class)
MFILEATVTSYGLLAIGGVVAMLLGSVMLMKADAPFLQVSWSVIVPVVVAAGALSLGIVGMGVRAMRRPPSTGREGMIGLTGVVKTALAPQGQILVRGEIWDASSSEPLQPGAAVTVMRIEGLRLFVKPAMPEERR